MRVAIWTFVFCAVCTVAGAAEYNPPQLADFQRRQFITPDQAQVLGTDVNQIVGSIAVQKADGTLEIQQCQLIQGSFSGTAIAELKQPLFNAVIDKKWELSGLFSILSLSQNSEDKVEISGTDIAGSILPIANIPNNTLLSSGIGTCGLSPMQKLYYIRKAVLSVVVRKNFKSQAATGSGIFSFLTIDGKRYTSETGSSNTYTVSVLALPIGTAPGATLAVATTVKEIQALGAKAFGADSELSADVLTASGPSALSKQFSEKLNWRRSEKMTSMGIK